MRRAILPLTLGMLLGSWPAAAQDGSTSATSLAPVMTDPYEQLPAALGFQVEQRTVTIENSRRILRFQTREKFPDAALRLKDQSLEGRAFGGGYSFLGWSHQEEGDIWRFTMTSPRGELFRIWLEAGAGRMAMLCIDTAGDGPSLHGRRSYHTRDDLGPVP